MPHPAVSNAEPSPFRHLRRAADTCGETRRVLGQPDKPKVASQKPPRGPLPCGISAEQNISRASRASRPSFVPARFHLLPARSEGRHSRKPLEKEMRS